MTGLCTCLISTYLSRGHYSSLMYFSYYTNAHEIKKKEVQQQVHARGQVCGLEAK